MNRKIAREMAMKLIFEMDIHNDFSKEMVDKYMERLPSSSQNNYIKETGELFITNKDAINNTIEESLKSWKIDRIAKTDLAILRLAVVEIIYRDDIPKLVSINEAIELGKTFSTGESSKFINGVLGNVLEKVEKIENQE